MIPIKSLKNRVIESGFWSLLNYVITQTLRFLGNLLLTRLLFPEAFGLVAIAQTIVTGVTMLSDVGVRNSIIQHPEGNKTSFLNTCWSIQIIQGLCIASVILGVSPLISDYYNHSELSNLLAIASLGVFINSFTSTKYLTANRNLNIKLIACIDIISYSVGLLLIIILAYYNKNVYSLMWGGVLSSFLKVVISHFYIGGISNKFEIDKTQLNVILNTGLWIFVSTAITFLLGEGSKLLIASSIEVTDFGIYNIANTMALITWGAVIQIASSTLYPALSEIFRANPDKFKSRLLKSRLILLPIGWLTSVFLVFFGQELMQFLYDPRYINSGKMLEIMAIGLLGSVVAGSYTVALFSMGEIKLNTLLIALEFLIQLIAIFVGFRIGGTIGLVWGITISKWVSYPIYALAFSSKNFLHFKLDLFTFFSSSIVIGFYFWPS